MYIGTTYEYLHCIHVNDERLGKRALHSHHVVRPQRGVGSGQRLACRGARRARRRRTPVARTRRAQTHVAQRDVPCVDLALELVDFLKCISALEWSMNSLSCKFLYQPLLAGPGWDVGFYRAIGLETLFALELVHPGDALGTGVTAAAARELGLAPGTAVATSLFNADAE